MKFRDLTRKTMSTSARRRARRLAEQDLAEMELTELREAAQLTQTDVAKRLNVSQVAISRLERRRDLKMSTLDKIIRALGGTLEIRAVMPARVIRLNYLSKPRKKAS